MKLKQSVLLCLSALFAASCTTEKKATDLGSKITDEIAGKQFTEIEVSSAFEVVLHKSDSCYVKFDYSEGLKDNIEAEITDGRLVLNINDINEADEFFERKHAHADIYMPSFDKINLTRASSLEFADTFNVDRAEIEIANAAELKKGKLIAKNLNINMSNASSLKAHVYADTLRAEIASACEADLRAINDRIGKLFEAEVSKASELDAEKLPFEVINVKGRSASSIDVSPMKKINAVLKGASVLEYNAGSKDLQKDIKTSGMSQVEEN